MHDDVGVSHGELDRRTVPDVPAYVPDARGHGIWRDIQARYLVAIG